MLLICFASTRAVVADSEAADAAVIDETPANAGQPSPCSRQPATAHLPEGRFPGHLLVAVAC